MTGAYGGPAGPDALDWLEADERLCECGRYDHPDPGRFQHDDDCPAVSMFRDLRLAIQRLVERVERVKGAANEVESQIVEIDRRLR